MIDFKNLKNSKHVENLKQGFADLQTVLQEGNLKLFVAQGVAILLIVLAWWHLSNKFETKVRSYNDQMAAIRIQQNSAQEYQVNKQKLVDLEPRFPDVETKTEWLLSQILTIFKETGVTPEVSGAQSENASDSAYIVASLPVTTFMEFHNFAELLASIENRDEYVKVSEFTLEKEQESSRLGFNKITMKFNTIFPKEKIAKKLFKDYDALIAARQQKKTSGQSSGEKQ